MILSKRMKAIADQVAKGSKVVDVGTDHGYIPIYLVEKGCCDSVIAVDVNEGPLKRAKKNIQAHMQDEKIECRLSNGLEKITADEADTIIIAGMGGALITQILLLGNHMFENDKVLILQPQSDYSTVRHHLHQMDYQIIEEQALIDEDKFYVILKAVPGNQVYQYEYEYQFGSILLQRKDPILYSYLQKERETYKKLLDYLSEMDFESTNLRKKEIEACLVLVEGALSRYDM